MKDEGLRFITFPNGEERRKYDVQRKFLDDSRGVWNCGETLSV